jgi:hypothetical protein
MVETIGRQHHRRIGPMLAGIVLLFLAVASTTASAAPNDWRITLQAGDFVIGPKLDHLHTHRSWRSFFDDQSGTFEVALKKSASPVPAPACKMDYVILGMVEYYPEDPRQAPLADRKAVYDRLLKIQDTGKGEFIARVQPDYFVRRGPSGPELTGCNLYFVLPLSWVQPGEAT